MLKSPRDQKAFLEETGPALEELGLKAVFLDTGFDSFYASSSSMLRATLTNVVVFFLVMLASWMLLLFVYLRQGRRSFAISRALGLSRRDGVRQMLIPILGIGGTGIVLGGAVSWSYALKQARETLSVLRDFENADPGASFSAWWLAGICLALVVLFAAVSYIGVSASTRRPVLELLQDGAGKREKVGVQDSGTDAGSGHEDLSLLSETLRELGHSPAAGASVNAAALRFLWRQIRRSRLKSALTASLALCFTFALGWINNSIEENSAEIDRLYGRISVKAEIMNESASEAYAAIPVKMVEQVLETGYVQSHYLEGYVLWECLSTRTDGERYYIDDLEKMYMFAVNDAEEYFASGDGRYYQVEYAEGYGPEIFEQDWSAPGSVVPVILPATAIEEMGTELGGYVSLCIGDTRWVDGCVAGKYAGEYQWTVFTPISALRGKMPSTFSYNAARFTLDPACNRQMDRIREELDEIVTTVRGVTGKFYILMLQDSELRDVVAPLEKSVQLMQILHPVTVAVAVLVALGVAMLMLLQAAKEAALMRALGSTKGRVVAALTVQQVIPCLAGLLVSLPALALAFRKLAGINLVYAGVYLLATIAGSVTAAVLVVRRSPMELLQVKE